MALEFQKDGSLPEAGSRLYLIGTRMESGLRILVLDDDPVMRELLEALLELAGHEVECFESCASVLERLGNGVAQGVDVLLTDLRMPGLAGHALLSTLRERRPAGTLLLGMSGSPPTAQERDLLEEFLLKPFSPDDLEAVVARARHGRENSAKSERSAPAGSRIVDEVIFRKLSTALREAQLRSLYELALNDIAGREERMRAAAETADTATLRSEAHAIKGGAGMIGAVELQRLAARLEEGDFSVTAEDFALGRARLRRMLDERLPSVL